jgi:hypothetical protein
VKPTRSLKDIKGMLQRRGRKPVTIEEMNEAMAKYVVENFAGKQPRGTTKNSSRKTSKTKGL